MDWLIEGGKNLNFQSIAIVQFVNGVCTFCITVCVLFSTVQRQVESYLTKLITIKPKSSVAPEAKPHIQAAPPQEKPKTTNSQTKQIAESVTPQEADPNESVLAHALQARKNDLKPTEVRML